MGKILDFLFGKAPDIFDQDGNVVHKFPADHWKRWQDRFAKNKDLDWHQHRAIQRRSANPPDKPRP